MTGEWISDRAGIQMTLSLSRRAAGLQEYGGRISAMVEGLAVFVGPMASNAVKPLGITSPSGCRTIPICRRSPNRAGFDSRGWFAVMSLAARHDVCARSTPTCGRCGYSEGASALRDAGDLRPPLTPAETASSSRRAGAWRPVVKKVGVTSP